MHGMDLLCVIYSLFDLLCLRKDILLSDQETRRGICKFENVFVYMCISLNVHIHLYNVCIWPYTYEHVYRQGCECMHIYIWIWISVGMWMCLPAKKSVLLLCLVNLFKNFQSHIVLINYIGKEHIEHAQWLDSTIYL